MSTLLSPEEISNTDGDFRVNKERMNWWNDDLEEEEDWSKTLGPVSLLMGKRVSYLLG